MATGLKRRKRVIRVTGAQFLSPRRDRNTADV